MNRKIIFCLLFALPFAASYSQLNCKSAEIKKQNLSDPLIGPTIRENEARIMDYLRLPQARTMLPVYTIPIVVHVIHSGEALGNINNPSVASIQSYVAQASNRFRHTSNMVFANNPFSGKDAEIQFCMALQTPAGFLTNGIVRYNQPAFAAPASYEVMKNYLNNIRWNPAKYCNVFIITTSPPDYSFSGVYDGFYDGTVYESAIFWDGLLAHELGHYFSLAHTFTGGCPNNNVLTDGDQVGDTPPKAAPGFGAGNCAAPGNGCTTDDDDLSVNNPFRPIANGGIGDRNDGLENYMDYTGGCWNAFTQGQVARMRASLVANRPSIITANPGCVLGVVPVGLKDFSGKMQSHNVMLQWTTSTEINSKQFEIYKSTDGLAFTLLGTVDAAGTSSTEKKYSYNDIQPSPGANYYKLHIVDRDGKMQASNTIMIKGQAKEKPVAVLNNPFTDVVNLRFDEMPTGLLYLNLSDGLGRIVYSNSIKAGNIINYSLKLENLNLSSGTYYLSIGLNGKSYLLKLLKK